MSSLPYAWAKAMNSARKLKNIPVARELAPAGLRSRPKTCYPILPDTPCMPDLRGLRPEREQAPSPHKHVQTLELGRF